MPSPKRVVVPAPPPFALRRDLACRNAVDPDLWYADKTAEQELAKRICQRCPAQAECLQFALKYDQAWGTWRAHTPPERRAILAEIERRQTLARMALPDPPTRAVEPWRWPGAHRVTPPGRVFDAARRVIGGDLLKNVQAATGINDTVLGEGVLVLRWAPTLEGDVRDGWVPLKAAARYARQLRDVHMGAA